MATAVFLVAVGCSGGGGSGGARDVILVIGDGMGAPHRDAFRLADVGFEGSLEMDDMPHMGLMRTNSSDPRYFVTDSAAAGTAIATGVKTYNGAVGVDERGEALESVLERAKEAGKATGLVTTSAVTDATPAAFGASVPDRNEHSEIARQYIEESKPDVMLGGGEDYWLPEGETGNHPDGDSEEGSRGTEGNLMEKAEEAGYEVVSDVGGLEASEGPRTLGLFDNDAMYDAAPEGEGGSYDPSIPLAKMADEAIRLLSENEDGFFLLLEEEGIDSLSHDNNAELTLKAGRHLDEAVRVAKQYAEENPDTLLIVAADHETGGLAVDSVNQLVPDYDEEEDAEGSFEVAESDTAKFWMRFTSGAHTAAAVPVTAMGPGAERLDGTYENTHLHDVMMDAMAGEE